MSIESFNFYPGGFLSSYESKILDECAIDLVDEFNRITLEFIEENGVSDLRLLLTATSRDSMSDSIYEMLCRVQLLIIILESDKAPSIIFTERAYVDIVKSAVHISKCKQTPEIKIKHSKVLALRILKNAIVNFLSCFFEVIFSRFFLRKVTISKMVYLDMFLPDSCISSEGVITDRYYTGFREYISDDCCKDIYISPILSTTYSLKKNYLRYKALSKSSLKFVFHENYLSVYDHFKAILLSVYLPMFTPKRKLVFRGIDITSLYTFSLRENIFSPLLSKSIKKYFLIKKLKKNDVSLTLVIDWFENQLIDRALALSVHKFFSNVAVHGYQGFPLNYNNPTLRPAEFEKNKLLLPDRIFYIHTESYDFIKMNSFEKIDINLSYALRYSHLLKTVSRKSESNVVLILTGYLREVDSLLTLADFLDNNFNQDVNILIKTNPVIDNNHNVLQRFKYSRSISVTDQSVNDLLSNACVVITSGSSVATEAVALGIPTVVYGNQYGITNCFLCDDNNDAWALLYDAKSVVDFIKKFSASWNKPDISSFELTDFTTVEKIFCRS